MLRSIVAAALILGLSGLAFAQGDDEELDPDILRIALSDAATTLQQGMIAGEQHGKAISAKFEMPNRDLQLSVYTATAGGFMEIVLNPKTGVVVSAELITDKDDVAQATAQKAALEKATLSLVAVTEKAINDNVGSRAVGVMPELRNGQPGRRS
jgi:hypothetical protein